MDFPEVNGVRKQSGHFIRPRHRWKAYEHPRIRYSRDPQVSSTHSWKSDSQERPTITCKISERSVTGPASLSIRLVAWNALTLDAATLDRAACILQPFSRPRSSFPRDSGRSLRVFLTIARQ